MGSVDISVDFKTKLFARYERYFTIYKEVFVKHEQAPTAPKLEMVCIFCIF